MRGILKYLVVVIWGDCFFLLFQYVHAKKLFIFSYWLTSIHV